MNELIQSDLPPGAHSKACLEPLNPRPPANGWLRLTLKAGHVIRVGDVYISVHAASGQGSRLGISAPKNHKIDVGT